MQKVLSGALIGTLTVSVPVFAEESLERGHSKTNPPVRCVDGAIGRASGGAGQAQVQETGLK
jgi:hypothetical protein